MVLSSLGAKEETNGGGGRGEEQEEEGEHKEAGEDRDDDDGKGSKVQYLREEEREGRRRMNLQICFPVAGSYWHSCESPQDSRMPHGNV